MNDVSIYYSNSKVNLGLKILNKRVDGFHDIHSLLIEISLADKLIFSPSKKFSLREEQSNNTNFPLDETNLISKAYKLLKAEANCALTDFTVHIKKNIPIGSGLGGGSSNAATTLKALNQLWDLKLPQKRLEALGSLLGADVPFFINGGFQLAEGVGEILTPQDESILQNLNFLLVTPPLHISTSDAYKLLNKPLRPVLDHNKFAPVSKPVNWQLFDNDFEKMIRKTYPEIGQIKQSLQDAGALFSGLSGSGSTVFGVFDNMQDAVLVQKNISGYQTFLASPVFHS